MPAPQAPARFRTIPDGRALHPAVLPVGTRPRSAARPVSIPVLRFLAACLAAAAAWLVPVIALFWLAT